MLFLRWLSTYSRGHKFLTFVKWGYAAYDRAAVGLQPPASDPHMTRPAPHMTPNPVTALKGHSRCSSSAFSIKSVKVMTFVEGAPAGIVGIGRHGARAGLQFAKRRTRYTLDADAMEL